MYNWMARKLLDGTHHLESDVDDISGHTKDWKEHMKILRDFFERVRKANLSLKPSKCKIEYGSIDFFSATLYMEIVQVHELNRLDAFCRLNALKQRNSAVVFGAW